MRTLYFDKVTGVALTPAAAKARGRRAHGTTNYDPSARGWVYDPVSGDVQNVLDGVGLYYITPEGDKTLHEPSGKPLLCDYFDRIEHIDGAWRIYQVPRNPKLVGVEVDGVMVSATKDDQNGLTAVFLDYVSDPTSFEDTNFKFQNGSVYLLTRKNILAFKTAWTAFRRSFF